VQGGRKKTCEIKIYPDTPHGLQRRLPAELPARSGQGRLGQDAHLVQRARGSPDQDPGHAGGEIISDRYLNPAIGACCTDNGHLLVSKHVKDLITRFAPAERPTMNAIPQERRRQFLDELAKITGAGAAT